MSDTANAKLWIAPVSDRTGTPCTILKLDVPPPVPCIVAVVLDLSDSCVTMQVEIGRLPRLLEQLPRKWPLWIYRLSDTEPLHASAVVAHLCDGSIDLMTWASNQRLADKARTTGSYLRPTIESIAKRMTQESYSRIKVLLLTDGELLDYESVPIPASMELVGLTASLSAARQAHWNRVAPNSRLCLLSDSSLEECFSDNDRSLYGNCHIDLQPLQSLKPILHFDPRAGSTSLIESQIMNWDFMDGPLLLQVSVPSTKVAECALVVTSVRTRVTLQVRPERADVAAVSPSEIAGFAEQLTNEPNKLFEVSFQDLHFQVAWRSYCEASHLANKRQPWTDDNGTLLVFRDPLFRDRLWKDEWKPMSDGWLCMSNSDPHSEPSASTRVAVFGLSRSCRPSLRWRDGEELWFGSVTRTIQIEFDPMENRWMLQHGTDVPRELNPRGSQALPTSLIDDAATWTGLFSGSLR